MRTLREITMHAAPARSVAAAALAALSFVTGCSSGNTVIPTPVPLTSTTLLTRLGSDTIAIERFTRTAKKMEGLIVTRLPVARVGRYSVDLAPNAVPTRADYSVRDGDGAALPGGMQSLSTRFLRDSVIFVGHRTAGDTTAGFGVRGGAMFPFVAYSYALYELELARLSATGRDSLRCELVPLAIGTRQAMPAFVRVTGPATVRVDLGGPLMIRHDGRGAIISADGSRTTLKVNVERIGFDTDLEAIARAWKAKDQGNAPTTGQISPRDTVEATVGAAHLWIDYGRPGLRGRDVWGANGVLGDTLWRTGANAATQFRTDVDLVLGGKTIPAGIYTLWTATTGGYQLVVNKQVGQWGTVYDSKQDLVRVPLKESSVATPVERFTIGVEPQSTGALLELTWGAKRLSVPVAAK